MSVDKVNIFSLDKAADPFGTEHTE